MNGDMERAAKSPGNAESGELLGYLREKGVCFWLEGDNLHFRAPKGAIGEADVKRIKEQKQELVRLLTADFKGPVKENLRKACRTPLSYSQLQHWNFYGLDSRPAVRHLAYATRLQGDLHIVGLCESVSVAVRRHDALRTRVVIHDGLPFQAIDAESHGELLVEDFTDASTEHPLKLIRKRIQQIILQPINPAQGPLAAFYLFRLSASSHIFFLTMEHMVSDMWSLEVLIAEIFTAYDQFCRTGHSILPPIRQQFSDYAIKQREGESAWVSRNLGFWNSQLDGCGRTRFPSDVTEFAATGAIWNSVAVRIDPSLMERLEAWSRQHQVTAVISMFSAYSALVLRWCNVTDTVIRFESNGRDGAESDGTIGYFTCPLYIRVKISSDIALSRLVQQIKETYFEALEHADHSYLEARTPRPSFSYNTAFNWVPERDESQTSELAGGLRRSHFEFINPFLAKIERDTEPFILVGRDAANTLAHLECHDATGLDSSSDGEPSTRQGAPNLAPPVIRVYFPKHRFRAETMERYSRNFVAFVRILIEEENRFLGTVTLVE